MAEPWYIIFTRQDPKKPCEWCEKAIELLKVYGCNFVERDYLLNLDMFEVNGFKTVPQIFIDDKYLGGHDKLKEHLENEQKAEERKARIRAGQPEAKASYKSA